MEGREIISILEEIDDTHKQITCIEHTINIIRNETSHDQKILTQNNEAIKTLVKIYRKKNERILKLQKTINMKSEF